MSLYYLVIDSKWVENDYVDDKGLYELDIYHLHDNLDAFNGQFSDFAMLGHFW